MANTKKTSAISRLRDQILGAQDLPSKAVVIPEWGCTVHVRTMTAGERDLFEQEILNLKEQGGTGLANIRARLVARCAVDEDGVRIFTDDDVAGLSGKSSKAIDPIFSAAQKLNGMSKKDVEELEGNS